MTGPFFYDPDRIVAIPNAVDTDFFTPAPEKRAPEPTVLYVGRLVQGKDPATLLQSFKIVTRNLPNARLEIVGNGPLRAKLDAIIRSMSLESAVRLIPGSVDIRPYLEKAWLFAMSSIREGSPNVIIEAMATGLPVVATRVGGIPELVEDGRTGKIVEPGNIKGLADALTDLLKNEKRRHEMGLRARKRVLDRHSPKKMARQTEQVFLGTWDRY
jgi:glycosyltransferase involved in cell wall biosynthesis